MILFCGMMSDPPLAMAIDAAERLGRPYVIFHQRCAAHTEIELTADDSELSGRLYIAGTPYALEEFSGVYLRLSDWQVLAEVQTVGMPPNPSIAEHIGTIHALIGEWCQVAPCRVLNRHGDMMSNGSKPYQSQVLSACGFQIPRTLVTNDPQEALEFVARGRAIYKSVSGVRSIVQEWQASDEARISQVLHLPTQFQEYVPGVNVRVHVVGNRVFATRAESEAVDYRYAGAEGTRFVADLVPGDIENRCVKASRHLNLPLCGLDLKRTPDGEWFCFEANPSPAYSCFEEHTSQPISEAIVDYVAGLAD